MKNNNMAAIAVAKSLLKEYSTNECPRTVYLNDGDEFQIKLFNPETCRVSVMIYIDGQYLGNDLILRPGESCWLERYLDRAKKFRFETYEVEAGNDAVDRAIKENGNIELRFYREKPYQQQTITVSSTIDLGHHAYFGERGLTYTGGDVVTNNTYTVSPIDCSFSTSASSNTAQATLDWVQPKTKETGRVSEGGYSDQRFQTVNVDTEILPFRTERIKILPRSQKPFTKNDLNKVFCTECGRKIKPKFKYCPFCGAKQE